MKSTNPNDVIIITLCATITAMIIKSIISIVQEFIGCALIYIGCLCLFSGILIIQLNTTNNESTKTLTINGPFNFSRNPIYLGMVTICSGLSLLYTNVISIAACIVLYCYLDQIVIPLEENVLKHTFGEQYNNYCFKVNRWI